MYKQYGNWMRRMGSKRDNNYGIIPISLVCIPLILVLISYAVWGEIGSSEVVWTDFSPQPTAVFIEEEITTIDKEKYRKYFEDRELVLMVLGGIEWWTLNCGKLTGTGNYFMNLGVEKHNITEEEMQGSMIFQTGHFAAALYNNCDVFLEQTKSIGLNIMLEKTSQETKLDTVPEISI
jgi:hypothetical protein